MLSRRNRGQHQKVGPPYFLNPLKKFSKSHGILKICISPASKKSRSSSASSHSSKKEEKAAPEPALDIEAAEVVDAGADADDEGEDDEVVEAVPAEAFELNEGGGEQEAHVTPVVEIYIKPKAPSEAIGAVSEAPSEESETEAPAGRLIVAPGAPDFVTESEDDVEAPEATPAEKESLTPGGRPIEYAAIEDVTEEDLKESEQAGDGMITLDSDGNF